MITDKSTMFSDSQAITASAPSSNVLDLGALGKTAYGNVQLKHNIGVGKMIPLLIQVTEDFATLTSLKISIETDDNDAFSSAKEILSQTVAVADLKKGFISALDKLPRGIKERYVRINYTVNGANATAGKIYAGLALAIHGQ